MERLAAMMKAVLHLQWREYTQWLRYSEKSNVGVSFSFEVRLESCSPKILKLGKRHALGGVE